MSVVDAPAPTKGQLAVAFSRIYGFCNDGKGHRMEQMPTHLMWRCRRCGVQVGHDRVVAVVLEHR